MIDCSILLHALDGGGLLPGVEVGLPGGTAAVRAGGPSAPLLGGLPDRDVADVVRLSAGPELPGDQLRGGVRVGGMAVGVPGGAAREAAQRTAEAPGDGSDGGPTGWLREPEARRRAGSADGVAGSATAA